MRLIGTTLCNISFFYYELGQCSDDFGKRLTIVGEYRRIERVTNTELLFTSWCRTLLLMLDMRGDTSHLFPRSYMQSHPYYPVFME